MYDLCIIGFGISGIISAKHAIMNNLKFIILEKNNDYGGCWYNKAFDFTTLQTVSSVYQFSDFKKPNYPLYPNKHQILDYLLEYITKYNINQYINYNSKVIQTKWNNYWSITYEQNTIKKIHSKYILICTGIFNTPNIPNYPFINKFTGKTYHTTNINKLIPKFKNLDITIIGNGATGLDLATELNKNNNVTILYRSPKILTQRYFLGISTSIIICRLFLYFLKNIPLFLYLIFINLGSKLAFHNYLELPKQRCNYKLISSNLQIIDLIKKFKITYLKDSIIDINENNIELKSKNSIKSNVIIYATGYKHSLPFLDINYPFYTYKFIIHPDIKNCGFIGLCPAYNWIQVIEIQSLWFINLIKGKINLPNENIMNQEINTVKQKKKKENIDYYDLIYTSFDYCETLRSELKLNNYVIKDLGYWLKTPIY